MNDLINNINSEKLKVGLYPITDNSWIDVGQWSEYQKFKKKLIKNEMSCCNSSKKWIKKLKNKNKNYFLVDLIEHTIDFAKKLNITPYILISTNDTDILKIAFEKKILTPWLRPSYISQDNSTSYSLIIHSIKWFKKTFGNLDYVILLQPTTPYRRISTVKKMINIFKKNKNSVATFTTKLNKNKKVFYIKNKKKFFIKQKKV